MATWIKVNDHVDEIQIVFRDESEIKSKVSILVIYKNTMKVTIKKHYTLYNNTVTRIYDLKSS